MRTHLAGKDGVTYDDIMSREEWRELRWWPNGKTAIVMVGTGDEITVSVEDYDHENHIPVGVFEAIKSELPESWKLENRGTRIELHPSGRFAGGWSPEDVAAVERALVDLGLKVEVRLP